MKTSQSKPNVSLKTRIIVKTAILVVIAFILRLIEFPVPLFPPFLKIDLSDIPAVLGSFALGPFAGVAIELLKNVLVYVFGLTTTGGVGELANFVIGSAWILPAALIYRSHKSKKTAVYGMLLGTIAMVIAGALMNYYIMIPLYAKFMPIEQIIQMSAAVIPSITDVKTLILYGIVPFNIFKGLILTLLTVLIYKRLSPILHK